MAATLAAMHPALDSLHKAYAEKLSPLSLSQTQIHPEGDPACWSTEQLVEHLLLSYRSSIRVLEERLQKGRATQAPVTSQHEMLWRRFIGSGIFPGGQKAPEIVVPGQANLPDLSGRELASLLAIDLEKMDGLLDACAGKFGSQPMASHVAFGPLSAEQWREFHSVHGRHHLQQLAHITAYLEAV